MGQCQRQLPGTPLVRHIAENGSARRRSAVTMRGSHVTVGPDATFGDRLSGNHNGGIGTAKR